MPAVLSDTTCMLCILTTAHSQQGFVGKCRAVFLGSKAGWNHSANATEGIMETSKVQQHPPAMYKHEVAYFLKISEGAGRKAADRDEACMKDDQRSPKPAEKKRWRPAETGISWDTQKNWQREACTGVSELNRLWRKHQTTQNQLTFLISTDSTSDQNNPYNHCGWMEANGRCCCQQIRRFKFQSLSMPTLQS